MLTNLRRAVLVLQGFERHATQQIALTVGNMHMPGWVVSNPPLKNVTATTDSAHRFTARSCPYSSAAILILRDW